MTVIEPDTVLLTDRLEHWADTKPDRIAVSYRGQEWTWNQWRGRIRRVAGALAELGIGRGDVVSVLDKNSPACLEVLLAGASIGAATAVINWRLAGDEITYVINDAGSKVLFAGAEFGATVAAIRDGLTTAGSTVIVGGPDDTYEALIDAAPPTAPQPDVDDDDVCLVTYSSGTTGRPKGVMLTHRNIAAHTRNVGAVLPFAPGDANLVAMPLFHVGGTCYSLFGIHAGVRTIITREPDAAALLGAIAGGATHAFFVPPVIAGILAAGEQAVAALSPLKYLVYGAAPMPLPLLTRALAAWPNLNFVQVYGQTELTGVIATLKPADHRQAERPERLGSAGTVVHGAETRVVDPATGTDVQPGCVGELWFRSVQSMKGYLNRPDATAETITSDGWLRTGDVGRIDDGGYIFIEDRLKDMIITGGENVYCAEVERVLAAHPAVREATVFGVPDERWGESVTAVVVAEPGAQLTTPQLITYAAERLAGYKVPKSIGFADELPRNANGKILKRELRKPYWLGRARQV